MQRRHFETIASLLVEQRAILGLSDKRHGIVCNMWADELTTTNPNLFSRYTFLKACEVV